MVYISLNAAILLVLVDAIDDLYMYVDMPPKKKKLDVVCAKK